MRVEEAQTHSSKKEGIGFRCRVQYISLEYYLKNN